MPLVYYFSYLPIEDYKNKSNKIDKSTQYITIKYIILIMLNFN